ncbi:MAG: hypothetical protein H7Y31_00920, partial [Chitinophagaceae bacterium]|nr:hypothetical protein [Chitinophagaceae bacterium]
MKQVIITLFCIALLSACRDEKKPPPPTENKSNDRTAAQADTSGSAAIDLTELILTIIKNQEFYQLAEYIHPTEGIRFSPYGYVDTARDVKLTKLEFVNQLNNPTSVTLWGSFDGSDQPIRLNLKDYVKRFVYDVDFLNAESRTFNHMVATGNTLQNLKSVYPESVFT